MIGTRWCAALAGLLLVSCHLLTAARPAPAATNPHPTGRTVQVVAHPDDDILFLNPDLAAGIHNGQFTASIYLTGGESDLPNPADYAARRQAGTRAAYARMAGVADRWIRRAAPVGGHRFVEIDQLTARPDVRLAFLNLPEDNNPAAHGGKHALSRLWSDPAGTTVQTLIQDGGVVRDSYRYRRADVVDVLEALFDRFRPSVIRTQDPQPDSRYQPEWGDSHDHPDHVSAARFTREAAQRYLAHPGASAVIMNYRDYNIANFPIDLSLPDQQAKTNYFSSYLEHDFAANLEGAYRDWIQHSYYRFSRGGSWAGVDGLGQVHAFAIYGTRMLHWVRDGDRRWKPPEITTPAIPLRPTLTVVEDSSGRLIVVAQSWDGSRVLVKRQIAPGGRWRADWTGIGSPPEPRSGGDTTQTGVPTATVDRYGRLVVFLKNAHGAVSMRREKATGGGWEDWRDLGGSGVQDGASVVADQDNRLHLFAPTGDRILHWREQATGSFEAAPTPFRKIEPAGGLSAARAPGGKATVFARTGDNGAFAGVSAEPVLGWEIPLRFPNPGGMAAPVVTARHGPRGPEFLVFARNSDGGVSACRPGGPWIPLGGQLLDQPTTVVESDGSVTLLATGDDGTLQINHEVPATARLTFGGWQPIA